ncbi:MAG: hypothetical protein NUW08_01705 [Candidatus Uhrbacteria bacterium]|nr:hypothetical protein [Candidatus Uhrbacteria bacterium]
MASIIECLPDAIGPGVGLKVIIPDEVAKTLRETCFRGKEVARAGNSSRWDGSEEMLRDPLFLERFREVVVQAIRENGPGVPQGFREIVSIQFEPDVAVGWLPAAPRDKINGASLHPAKIGDRAYGMMVSVKDAKHPAPLTNLFHLELAYSADFKHPDEIVIRILGMGIGQDLGPLDGDLVHPFHVNGEIVARRVVFFRPDHAGGDTILPLDP